MKKKSILIYEAFMQENGGNVSYGVRGRRIKGEKTVEDNQIAGIFKSMRQAEDFARLLEEKEIYPCHMEDIAEDILSDC